MLDTSLAPWPSYSNEEIEAVEEVLRSNRVNYWTGTVGRQFEEAFASYLGCRHAIALANGTVAIDLAFYALGLEKGDEIIVTSRTFLASASCIVNMGAIPIFADVDLDSQNITSETIRPLITPKTKAILCVHLAGWPCEMDGIMALADEFGLKVIEDCAQAQGAIYKGRKVGTWGHASAFSFCQDKIITTGGEGGLLTTDDTQVWSKAWSFKDHGKSWDAVYNREHPYGFKWLHESFGTNWRLTEIQSAIGLCQLKKLDGWVEVRQKNAEILRQICTQFSSLRVPLVPSYITHANYKFYAFIKPEFLKQGWDRDKILMELNNKGIPCTQGSCSEVYLEKAFDGTSFRPQNRLPNAKLLGETSMMFLVHPTLTPEDLAKMCQGIDSVMKEATI